MRNPPRRSQESWNKLTFANAARRKAERQLIDAHPDEFDAYLNQERDVFGLPPINRREKTDA